MFNEVQKSSSLNYQRQQVEVKTQLSMQVLDEISQQMKVSASEGNYVLPKTTEELRLMADEGRLSVLLGREFDGTERFLASCGYYYLGDENGVPVFELGALIRNDRVTINPEKQTQNKVLVEPLGGIDPNTPLGQQIITITVQNIQSKHPGGVIIATSRSPRSMQALMKAGFSHRQWVAQRLKLSCDSRCLGVEDHTNCEFAGKNFSDIPNQSGCIQMVYINQ